MIVVVRGPKGIDYGVVDGPVAFPCVSDLAFGSTEGEVAGVDKMGAPVLALRNATGKAAVEMFVSAVQKASTRRA